MKSLNDALLIAVTARHEQPREEVTPAAMASPASRSSTGSARSGTGTGWKRLGPSRRAGKARVPHTGSVSTREPSISVSVVEWPDVADTTLPAHARPDAADA